MSWAPSASSKTRSIDDAVVGGEGPEGSQPGAEVDDHLIGHLVRDAGHVADGGPGALAVTGGQQRLEDGAQRTHLGRELGRAGRCLAQPEGDGRRQVGGVVHPHGSRLDLHDPPRVGPEQEDVAGGGLDGEVLVHRADGHAVGVEDHPVVARLGDGATAGEGGEPRPTPGPEPTVDGVVVEMGAASSAAGADAPRHQLHHLVEVVTAELGVGRGPARPGRRGRRHRALRLPPPRPPSAGPARRAGRPGARGGRGARPAPRPAAPCTRRARRG